MYINHDNLDGSPKMHDLQNVKLMKGTLKRPITLN